MFLVGCLSTTRAACAEAMGCGHGSRDGLFKGALCSRYLARVSVVMMVMAGACMSHAPLPSRGSSTVPGVLLGRSSSVVGALTQIGRLTPWETARIWFMPSGWLPDSSPCLTSHLSGVCGLWVNQKSGKGGVWRGFWCSVPDGLRCHRIDRALEVGACQGLQLASSPPVTKTAFG